MENTHPELRDQKDPQLKENSWGNNNQNGQN